MPRIMVPLVYHPRYNITAFGLERLHPFDSTKYRRIHDWLIRQGLRTSEQFHSPQPATRADLLRILEKLLARRDKYDHILVETSGLADPTPVAQTFFANEQVRTGDQLPSPDVDESEETDLFRVISLEALVRIKVTAFQDKDRTHLRDLIEVGLVDAAWISKLPSILGERLRQLLDTPEG